jgi:hypothetical protein
MRTSAIWLRTITPSPELPGLACITLQEHTPVLVRTAVVEPTGTHERVRQSPCAHQPLGAPLPVVGFSRAVVSGGICPRLRREVVLIPIFERGPQSSVS